jgi:Flp pilus assembly CpaE family ATPase
MVLACWSVKGGSGTTVVASALALRLARATPPVVLADLAGDVPAVLGRPDPSGPGLADWLAAAPAVAPDALSRLTVDAGHGLGLLPWRGGDDAAALDIATGAGGRLVDALRAAGHNAVVDCGSAMSPLTAEVIEAATRSLLVVRPCYLALRRAIGAPRPSAVVLVAERERTLSAADVEDVLGVPVVATVDWDPTIARAVDAGLLATRVPRPLERALRQAA